MTGEWSAVQRQQEASRWFELSMFAFWLRHPEALDARPSNELAKEAQQFRRLGQELHVLEYDLTECLNEFKTAYQALYRDSEHLHLKKFSIVYHIDNFNVRVHKLNESVEALLALLGGVDPKRRSRRELVESALKRDGRLPALGLIRRFREGPSIKDAVEARNRFVHLYHEEPDSEWRWSMLAPTARIREYHSGPDQLGEELRRIVDSPHVDDYADEQANLLLETLHEIQQFRDDLNGIFLSNVAALVITRDAGTQARFQWVVDLDEFWREALGGTGAKTIEDGPDPGRGRNAGEQS